ncbi:hypothetical protein [Cetobacterium somerae]
MKLKYKNCIKSFILFTIFNILSLFTFAIPEGMKPNGSEEPIPPVMKKTRAITSSFDVNEGDGFIIQDIGSGNIIVNKKNLVNGNNSITPKTLNVGGNTNNAFGYNSKDNYIYGIQMVTNSGHNLIKIGKDSGTVGFSLGKITGISLNESIFIGDFDKDGNMYVAGNNNVYKITIASNGTANAANIGSRESSTFADWGYTEINGKERFYYILNNGTLKYYEKSGGGLTGPTQVTTGLSTDRGTVVAVFMAGTNMFYNPSGTNTIYKVDLTAITPTSLSFTSLENTTTSGDGARNYSKLIPNLAVGKEITNGVIDTNGDKIFSQGDEIKYKLVIKNSGNYPLGADDISKYIISDKVDLNKVESVATNVVAKKFPTLIGGIGTVVNVVPTTLTYDSTGKFELASELGKLPRLEIGERLEIEYTLKIKIYDFSGDTDRINNTVTGAIPNKQVTSDSQASVVILKPLVIATKISDKTGQVVQPGDEIEYTLTLTNTGKVPSNNYPVKDSLLTNEGLSKPTLTITGGTLTGDIFENSGGTITVPAQVGTSPGVVTITYKVIVPTDYAKPTIVNSLNSGQEIVINVEKPVVLSTKTSDKTGQVVQAGEVIGYTLKLTNTTKVDAKNYVVKDTLLSNPLLTKPTDVLVEGGTLTGDIFDGTGGSVTVPAGKTVTITYTVTVPSAYPNETIVNSVNNGEEVVIEYDDPSVSVVKTSDKTGQVVQAGEVIGYTLKLTNTTKVDAKNYVVKDTLLSNPLLTKPTDVLVEGGMLTGDIFDGAGGSVTVPAGKTVTITYTVTVPSAYPNETIVNSVNNGEEVVIEYDDPSVSVVKTSDKTGQVVQAGEVIGYTLKLTNTTKVDAKNYVVKDTLLSNPLLTKPTDVLVEGGTLTGDIFDGAGGSVTVPAGKTVTITYTVTVPSAYPNETIVNSVNNGEEVVIEYDDPSVSVVKTSDKTGQVVQAGEVIGYTLKLTNTTKVDAKNYVVKDTLLSNPLLTKPTDVLVEGGTLTGDIFDGAGGSVTVPAGKTVTITYTVTVPSAYPNETIVNSVNNGEEVVIEYDDPSVSVVKTSDKTGQVVQAGEVIGYTLKLTNTTKVDAKNYVVKDTLLSNPLLTKPTDVLVEGGTLTGDIFDGTGGSVTVPAGKTVTITYTVTVPSAYPNETIVNSVNNGEEVVIEYDDPSVSVVKTSDKTGQVVQAGEVIGYTLKLTNTTKVDAKNYVVKDTLLSNPLLTKPTDVLVEGGTLTGDIFDGTGGSVTVPAGKTVTITYTVTVPSAYPNETIVNSVNNGEEVVIEYDDPNVSVVKTSDKTGQVVQAGEVIGYTLKLTNTTKVDAKNYVVKDTLLSNPLLTKPTDVLVEGGTLTGDIFDGAGGSVTVPAGKTVTITYTVIVPSAYPNETIVNSVNNGEEVVIEYDDPNVSVVKTSDKTGQVVQAGEVIGYTLKLTNTTKVDAKNYVVKDTLLSNPLLTKPTDVLVEGGTLTGDIFDGAGGSVTVPAGKTVTITYTVTVPSAYPNETIVNSVNNGEEVVIEYDDPSVSVVKTSDKTGQVVQAGEVIGYTLKLTNTTKVDAKNYVVKDTLLSNPLLTKPTDVLVEGGTLTGDIFDGAGGSVTVPAGKTVTITYTVTVPSAYPNETIVNSVNNGEEVVIEYDDPNVSVVKTSDKTGQVVQAGEVIGYTLKLTNTTKVDAKNYVVKDTLLSNPLLTKPTDVLVEGGTLTGDIFDGTGGSVTVPAGKTVTITYTVTVPSAYPNETIVNSVNNGEEVVIEYDDPNVSVVKTSDKTGQVVQAGEVIGYTLKLTNTTKVDAKNYVVKDTLLSNPLLTKPTDVLVEGGTLTGDIFDGAGGSVTVPAGKTVTITYTVIVPSAYPNETIVNSVNNGEEVVIEYDDPNVSVVKTSDKTGQVVQAGEVIGYTLKLTNTTKVDAKNYVVKDTLLSNPLLTKPTDVLVEGGTLTGDIFDGAGGSVTVPAGKTVTITYTVTVPSAYPNETIVNSVNNGEEVVIEYDDPNVSVVKTSDKTGQVVQAGEVIGYTLKLTNTTKVDAKNYVVKDTLLSNPLLTKPTDVLVEGGTLTGDIFDGTGGSVTVPAGKTVTITYTVTVPSAYPNETIVNSVNNGEEVVIEYDDPNVSVVKTSDKTGQVVQAGEVIGYTLKLTNTTKVDAKNYVVKDTLLSNPLLTKPTDVLVEGGTLTGDIFDGAGGSVTVPAGKTVTITYTVTVPSAYPNETIVNSVNNGEEVVIEYDDPSVSVVKTSDKTGQVVQAGEVIGYTLKLTNTTKVDAKNYVVKDTLLSNPLLTKPTDVLVEGGTLTGDIFDGAGGSVTVPAEKTVTITYTVTVPSAYPNETIVNSVNNGEEVVIEYDDPSVSVVKTSDKTGQVVQAGEVIGYTLKLTNTTKVDAKNYVVKDTLLSNPLLTKPTDVLVEGGTLTGDIFDGAGGSVTVPAEKTVTITYTVTVPSAYPNETIVNSVNNGEEVVIEYDDPSVSVVKTSDKTGQVVQAGEVIGYTLKLTNTTKVDAKNYVVKDTLLSNPLLTKPTDVLVEGGTLTGDIFDGAGGSVTVPAEKTVTITYTVTVPSAYPNETIVNSVNNGEEVVIEYDDPSVSVVKTSDKTGQVVQAGEVIGYTLKLTNTTKVDATNYVVKDTLLSNPLLTKPTDVLVEGGTLTGDIFDGTGGSVTVPAEKIVTITYTVTVPSAYPNETIVNSANEGENIIIEVDKPNVRLRHDVFAYEEKFDDSDELINQDEGIVTDFENIENKNSNPPVILPGNKAIHFISLINPSKVDLKGKSDINHQLDGKQLKDDEGNPVFNEHKFQGIVLTNLDTNEKIFYSEKELSGGQTKAKNARMLPEANELKITPKTSSFTFEEKIPLRTAISFVFSSTVNPEGTFNKNTRISSYAFLPFDSEQNTSEGELRKAVIVIGRREADLVLSKSVEIEEASIGKFVPYTIEIKNMGKDSVDNVIISDKLPPGFTYVEGSAVQELKDGYAQKKLQVIGTKEIEIGPISQIKSGETIVIKYLLKVGVGVKPGTYKNIAVVKNENKENISNTDSVDIDIVADPIFEHTTVIGKVFHDRDEDGIQDYANARKAHITVNIPKEYYVKNTTTVSKEGKIHSFADNYETIIIRNIKGRVSELEPATNNMVVIRKELIKPVMANVRVQTFGGTDITQQGNGEVITNHTGDKIKGMTNQDIVITQRVIKNKDNKIILEVFVLNNGIQEEGLPGVRLATPEGIVVETDRFGRYHVPPVPETLGKNYIIKVDPTTLPKGSEFTTENPRVRHLGKVMMKFNFGVKLPSLKNPEKKDKK